MTRKKSAPECGVDEERGDVRHAQLADAKQGQRHHRVRRAPLDDDEGGERRGGDDEAEDDAGAREPVLRPLDERPDERPDPERPEQDTRDVEPPVLEVGLARVAGDERRHDRDERKRDVEEEDHAPRDRVHERAADHRSGGGRDPRPRRPGADRLTRLVLVRRAQQGEAAGGEQGAEDALYGACGDEDPGARCEAGKHGSDREPGDADDERVRVAVAVAERARREVEGGEGERVAEEDPLLAGQAEAEVLVDRRQGDIDDERIEERHRRAEDRRDEDESLTGLGCHAGR
jgi:hypothetical protein